MFMKTVDDNCVAFSSPLNAAALFLSRLFLLRRTTRDWAEAGGPALSPLRGKPYYTVSLYSTGRYPNRAPSPFFKFTLAPGPLSGVAGPGRGPRALRPDPARRHTRCLSALSGLRRPRLSAVARLRLLYGTARGSCWTTRALSTPHVARPTTRNKMTPLTGITAQCLKIEFTLS